jgi:uncharacterized membrane protein YbaN (DUF454 family)
MVGIYRMKNWFWKIAGFILLGITYLGIILPGLPFSPFLVGAAICFSKGSPAMHKWLYNHKHFGPFLTNWIDNKIFPTKMKYMMLLVMASSLAILWFTTYNIKATCWSGGFMLLVAIWAWRFPGSLQEYYRRDTLGKKMGWFK